MLLPGQRSGARATDMQMRNFRITKARPEVVAGQAVECRHPGRGGNSHVLGRGALLRRSGCLGHRPACKLPRAVPQLQRLQYALQVGCPELQRAVRVAGGPPCRGMPAVAHQRHCNVEMSRYAVVSDWCCAQAASRSAGPRLMSRHSNLYRADWRAMPRTQIQCHAHVSNDAVHRSKRATSI